MAAADGTTTGPGGAAIAIGATGVRGIADRGITIEVTGTDTAITITMATTAIIASTAAASGAKP
jgi:hypothetical protein